MNDINVWDMENISPYDFEFPIDFLHSVILSKIEAAQNTISEVLYEAANYVPIFDGIKQNKDSVQFIVSMNEAQKEAVKNGLARLDCDKNGKLFAQLRMSNGHFGEKLEIREEYLHTAADPIQIAEAVQMIALQEQLNQVSEQLNIIDNHIHDVLQGLQNDRIGLYYSGVSMFIESRNITDENLRNSLTAQSLSLLSEAYFQLSLKLKSNVQYLLNKEYRVGKGNSVKLIEERMKEIDKEFAIIHQSAILRAGIYCYRNEISAMSSVLNDYSAFINNVIAPNSDLLIELDVRDKGLENGIWNTRSKLNLNISDFRKLMNSKNKTIYLNLQQEAAI